MLKKLESNSHHEMTWLCKCDCGSLRTATTHNLTTGRSLRCHDCKVKFIAAKNYKHSNEPIELWHKYTNMKTRCYNQRYVLYHRYGGRGIKVCDEWKDSFNAFREWAFASGYEKGLTLDRIDNDGDYCPDNCRWATMTEQANNRSTNRIITVNGESDTLANWVRRVGEKYGYIQHLLDTGHNAEEVIGPLVKHGDEHVYI